MPTATPLHHLVRQLRQATELQLFEGLSDTDLLDRFRSQGDGEAFTAIVRRHGLYVLAACRKVLHSEADVEDVFQATFVVLLRQAGVIRRGTALSSYLYGVAHRLALKTLEAARCRRKKEQQKRPAIVQGADLSWAEACAILHEELDRLPDTYRLPLLLCYLEGMSRDEAAQQLGCTLDVLRGRLERGRDRLRHRLRRRGVSLSAGLLAAVTSRATATPVPERLLQATLAATSSPPPATVASLVGSIIPAGHLGKLQLLALMLVLGLTAGSLGLVLSRTSPIADTPAKAAEKGRRPQPVAAADRPNDAQPDRNTLPVSGKVVGPDGKPVAGAKLFLFDGEQKQSIPQGETNRDGGFALELQPMGDLRSNRFLVAAAPALGLGCDWVRMSATTEKMPDTVLKLPRDEPIRGQLITLEGQPVAWAKVRVVAVWSGMNDSLNEFLRLWSAEKTSQQDAFHTLNKWLRVPETPADFLQATTDAEGRFTLTGIGRDRCPQLTIRARGLASHAILVPIRPDFQPPKGPGAGNQVFGPVFTLPLLPARPIIGVVRDADRRPLAGVRVSGQPDRPRLPIFEPYNPIVPPDAMAVTNTQGEYLLDGLPGATKYLLVADPGPGQGATHQIATRNADRPGFAALPTDFDLPRGVVVTGRVTDRTTGRPIQALVFWSPLQANRWLQGYPDFHTQQDLAYQPRDGRTNTDADGRFRLTAAPGPGILHVQILNLAVAQEYLPPRIAPEDETDEILQKDWPGQPFKTSGPDRLKGTRFLHAYRVLRIPDDARTFNADVTVTRGVSRVVKIVGPDGQSVSGAWVLNDKIWGQSMNPPALPGAEFTARVLEPDSRRRIYAQHNDRQLAGFVSLDGKETGPAILQLQPMATVLGRVVDREDQPLKNYSVSPLYDDPDLDRVLQHRIAATAVTDATGQFTLRNMPAGLTVRFQARIKVNPFLPGPVPSHGTPKYTLKPGETLNLGDWKPK